MLKNHFKSQIMDNRSYLFFKELFLKKKNTPTQLGDSNPRLFCWSTRK